MNTRSHTATLAFSLLAALCLAPRAGAQEPGNPLALLPRDCMVVFQMDAPAQVAEAFAKTRLGALFSRRELERWAGPVLEESRGLWAMVPERYAVLLEGLLEDFRGKVTFALHGVSLPGSGGLAPLFLVCLTHDDPDSPFFQKARELAAVLEEDAGVTFHDLRVEDRVFRATAPAAGGGQVTLPLVAGRHVMVFGGGDLEAAIPAFLPPRERSMEPRGPELFPPGAVALHVDLKAIVGLLDRAVAEAGAHAQEEARGVRRLLDLSFDFSVMERLSLMARPSGPFTLSDMELRFNGPRTGLLSVMEPAGEGRPDLLDLLPSHLPYWTVGALRLDRLHRVVRDAVQAVGDLGGFDLEWEDVERGFEEMFQVRLQEDLLDHLGPEVLMVGLQPVVSEDALAPESPFGMDLGAALPYCFGFSLRDAGAFGASLERLVRSRGLHAGRRTEDYHGVQVHRIRPLGFLDLYYAVSDRVVLVALGERAAQGLRAVLDEERARREGRAPEPLPSGLRERLEHGLARWQWISGSSIVGNVDATLAGLRLGQALDPAPTTEVERRMTELLTAVLPAFSRALADHGLQEQLTVVSFTRSAIHFRHVW